MAIATAVLTACSATPRTTTQPSIAPAESGLDYAGFDRSVRPQDDLFRFVNGQWLETTEIPPDRSNYGAFTALDDKAQSDLRAIVEEAAGQPDKVAGSEVQKVGDFYLSFMDTARIDALGLQPLAAELGRIEQLSSRAELVRYLGQNQRIGLSQPVALYVSQDEKNTTSYITYVTQRGLTLPDRDYYLKTDEKSLALRDQYLAYVTQLLQLAAFENPAAAASRILQFETRLAQAQWTRVQNRDALATYNKLSIKEANALTPGLDWGEFLAGAGVPVQELVISQPSFFTALGQAVTDMPLADWRLYLQYKLINDNASYLSTAFVDLNFDFMGRRLKGIEENRPRWKRAVEAIDQTMGELVGHVYVQKHFKPAAKQRMDELVANLLKAFEVSIDQLDWMGPQTKLQARAKLAHISVKIAYPDKWKDYSALTVAPDDLMGNLLRSAAVEHERYVAKLGKPIDRGEWLMTPQTVNAYYYPPMNEIVFPAAILQPPFFNAAADDAVNYGAIGAVIGHEISHGFDDQGRKYDGAGNLRDWWTAEDQEKFQRRAAGLAAQYSAFNPIDDLHVNGEFTLGENIGDLSGVAVAFKAWQLSLGGKPAPVIDGFTGEQRFFLGWSQVWRRKYRDEELRVRLRTDPHSPSEYRANGVVANMEQFYAAFGLKEGDRLYRKPQERVKLW